jgi:hypothetical protein
MILQNKVLVSITNRNRGYYRDLGYSIDSNEIIIDIIHLPKGSNIKIEIGCDICFKELQVPYYNYNKYMKNYGIYTCKICSIDNKTKKTNMKRYGVESPLQCEDILNKLKETNLKKYGYTCSLLSTDVKNKTIATSLKKYKTKIPCSSKECKKKRKLTNNIKYGVDNVFQSNIIKDKIKNGKNLLSINKSTEWLEYKNEVRKITRKFKKELYNNWNGLDYYDNEYIKENLNLHYNDRKYPTVDHKISTYYGFLKDRKSVV